MLPRPQCGVAIAAYPALSEYRARHAKRPSMAAVLRAEAEEYSQPGWWTAR